MPLIRDEIPNLPPCAHEDVECFYCTNREDYRTTNFIGNDWHADCSRGRAYQNAMDQASRTLRTRDLIWPTDPEVEPIPAFPDTPEGRIASYVRCAQCTYTIYPANARETFCRECDVCVYCCRLHAGCYCCGKRVLTSTTCLGCGWCRTCIAALPNAEDHSCYMRPCCSQIARGNRRPCTDCGNCTDCCNCQFCSDCDNAIEEVCFRCNYCRNCCSCVRYRSQASDPGAMMLNYSASPLKQLGINRKDLKGKTLYGVELEVEVSKGDREEQMEKVHKIMLAAWDQPKAAWIFKDDGSLSYGWEIVTAPLTLAQHRKLWSRTTFPEGVISYQRKTTGLHVHTSRPPALTRGKVFEFLNNKENWEWLSILGQRKIGLGDESHYYAPAFFGNKDLSAIGKIKEARYHTDHYLLYNPNTDKGTTEMRFFKGNTNPAKIIRAVEFAAAIHAFAADTKLSQYSMDAQEFFDYVTKTPKAYPNLSIWIKEYTKKPTKKARKSNV